MMMQMVGSYAEFERAIRECTSAGPQVSSFQNIFENAAAGQFFDPCRPDLPQA